MAASRWRARLVLPLIIALAPVAVAAEHAPGQAAPAEPATTSTQPAPAEPATTSPQPAAGQPTLSLTLEVRADTLRFDAGPSLTVSAGNLVDTCQFASGVTYRDVHLRLEVSETTATLACDVATADQHAEPSTEDDEEVAVPAPAEAEAP